MRRATVTHSPPDRMMESFVGALLLAATASAWPYPRYEEVVRDPKTSDLLYGVKYGTHTENWYFSANVYLTSVIIPSQIIDFCKQDTGNGTYQEEIDLVLFEIKLSPPASQKYPVATGSFKGTVTFGQELDIALKNDTLGRAPRLFAYGGANSGYRYHLQILFKTAGVYPWYTSRALSTYSVVHASSNLPGIAIGLSYAI